MYTYCVLPCRALPAAEPLRPFLYVRMYALKAAASIFAPFPSPCPFLGSPTAPSSLLLKTPTTPTTTWAATPTTSLGWAGTAGRMCGWAGAAGGGRVGGTQSRPVGAAGRCAQLYNTLRADAVTCGTALQMCRAPYVGAWLSGWLGGGTDAQRRVLRGCCFGQRRLWHTHPSKPSIPHIPHTNICRPLPDGPPAPPPCRYAWPLTGRTASSPRPQTLTPRCSSVSSGVCVAIAAAAGVVLERLSWLHPRLSAT